MLRSWLSRLGPFHSPDDLNLPPTAPVVPTADPAPVRERRHNCEFCECQLTTHGEVLKVSDKARAYREQDETIARLEKELALAKREAGTLREQLTAATAPSARRSSIALAGK